jgi:hypothetical protein
MMIDIRALLAAAAVAVFAASVQAAEPMVVTLTQVGCQFLESENGVDHRYAPKSEEDCAKINGETEAARLAKAKTIELKPGKYLFRVSNKNVPYELGFWLRGASLASRITLPSVSGGGLFAGKTQDYAITLKPGEYLYSCPLNTTPDYRLVVVR